MEERQSSGILRKVLLAFGLGAAAIVIALSVSYFGLNKMLTVVYDLGAPNEKLKTLNNLYRKATDLNNQQRIDAIRNPLKPDRDFLKESNDLLIVVDSLLSMKWNDTLQPSRLREMQDILKRRNNLFLSYLRSRSDVTHDKVMAVKFDSLSEMLSNQNIVGDTSVLTSEKKRTTITYVTDSTEDSDKRPFLSKLFRRRPTVPPTPDRTVTEEVEVKVDTISVAMSNKKIAEATKLINELGTNEITRRRKLEDRELELLRTTQEMFVRLVELVQLVEAEELAHIQNNNEQAAGVVNDSSNTIAIILLVFSLMAAALIYLIVTDISRSNFYRKRLVREKERAEELSSVKERFLSNMSHEIRTPLQSIIGYSEQMLTNPEVNLKPAIQAISSSSEHLLQIVNEVLDYSRLEQGKIDFEKKNFYLVEVAEEIASAMQIQADNKSLEFVFNDDEAENEFVNGDAFRLRQVLYNLIGNAIKFTTSGQVKLSVSTYSYGGHVQATFAVSDTGIGIRSSEMNKIFKRFEQANSTIGTTYGGTGLGLTIVKMIVEAQGGKLLVESKEGQGSTFKFELSYPKAVASKTKEAPVATTSPSDVCVLVLDDDPLIIQLCCLMLENGGIRYRVHPNPKELFETDIDADVTHVLTDVWLGDINGIDLCRSMKARNKRPVTIIAMTAMAIRDTENNLLKDFDRVLLKPFRHNDLYRVLGVNSSVADSAPDEDDFSAVRKLTMNDEELFKSVLRDFVTETERDMLSVEGFMSQQQRSDLRLTVHRLGGRIRQFGFRALSSPLTKLEVDVDGAAFEELNIQWQKIKDELNIVINRARAIS